jgi:beta-ribofuranosylaminobenzene 5'-phosphate synthase
MTDNKHSRKTAAKAGVTINAPARLHLGFLDLNGSLGRRFGSIGLAISEPATNVSVEPASEFSASGDESERALKLVKRLAAALELPGAYKVHISSAIPAHAGLGSGTQLALSIGSALARINNRDVTTRELGELVERGARSAIGMAAFDTGGFVIDGGRGPSDHAPPVLARHPFPESWRVLLVMDPKAVGVHGDRERRAFANLPEFSDASAGHLSRLILMRLLPGLVEADLATFGQALTEIQHIVGSHFAPAQGGSAWSSPAVGRACERLAEAGAKGIGQSSWGPTGFAFAETEAVAKRLYASLVEDVTRSGLSLSIVSGRNTGARVSAA